MSGRELRALWLTALRRVRVVQDQLIRLLGSSAEARSALVAAMLERNAHESTTYWLQLVVSIGIATLGLVVGSVAVIIGAMLVAPLMGPIIALAMGLAAGSPFLVLRSATRIALSVIVAMGGAAVITLLLPFHEINSEIAGRTSPTVLDLITAGFCALAGVYASLRPGSSTATTAAGTSIGISLVPPLCASGYGLGTSSWSVAGGAALLFLTNLVAIIFVGTVSYVAAGFNRVNAAGLEREALSKDIETPLTGFVARQLAGLFESRAGPALRFLMPLVLLGAVYVPLRSALNEVAWQVRVRADVRAAVDNEPGRIVQSHIRVERHQVEVVVVLLGKTSDGEAARVRLDRRIREASGVVPRVEVLALPDSTQFAGLESTLRTSTARDAIKLPPTVPPPTEQAQLETGRELVRSTLGRLWPSASAGEPLTIEVGTAKEGPLPVRVVHLGPALGPDAVESLARSVGAALEREVTLLDVALPAEALTRADGDLKLVGFASYAARLSAQVPSLSLCVVEPSVPPNSGRRRVDAQDAAVRAALREVLEGHPRLTTVEGDAWSVRVARGGCAPALDAGMVDTKAAEP